MREHIFGLIRNSKSLAASEDNLQNTGKSSEGSLSFLEGGLQTKPVSSRLSDWNMKHPGEHVALALEALVANLWSTFSDSGHVQPFGPRIGGRGREQGKHLSQALKISGVDFKRNLLPCRNAAYNASCWKEDWSTHVCIGVSVKHLTSNVFCAPSLGILTANLQGKDGLLKCPHNGQKQPIRSRGHVWKSFILLFLALGLSPLSISFIP